MSVLGLAGDQWGFIVAASFTLAGALFAVTAQRTFHSAMGLGVSLVGIAFAYIALGSPLLGVIQVLVYVGGILTLLVFAVMFVAADEEGEELDGFTRERTGAAPGWAHGLIGGAVLLALFLGGAWGRFYGISDTLGDAGGGGGQQLLFVIGMVVGILLFVVVAAVAWYVLYWLVFRAQMRVAGGLVIALALGGTLVAVVMDAPAWESHRAETTGAITSADDLDGLVTALFKDHVFTLEVLGVLLTAAMIGALVIARPLDGIEDRRHYDTHSEAELATSMSLSEPGHIHIALPPLGILRPAGAPPEGAVLRPTDGGEEE